MLLDGVVGGILGNILERFQGEDFCCIRYCKTNFKILKLKEEIEEIRERYEEATVVTSKEY